MFQRDVPKGY
ncbi:hypothetical protein A2U01_0074468, partial [Trifolium medium]|nr:hypothetical protein [Trifolium medium]